MQPKESSRKFINVLSSDGTFRMVVPEGTEGSECREWETKDGKSGVKHELVFETAKGKITDVQFRDSDYGEQLLVTLEVEDEQEEPVTVSLNTNQPFAEDFMKKLPNIDLSKDVILRPYNFTDDKDKNRRGMAITQETEGEQTKIQNFYYDPKQKKPVNGYPAPSGDESTSDDWKVYFIGARKFLVGETKTFIEKKREAGNLKQKTEEKTMDEVYDEITKDAPNPDGIPF